MCPWLDIVALGSLRPLGFLSKAEVADWPFAGWLDAPGRHPVSSAVAPERGDTLGEA